MHTGLRASEFRNLKWADYDRDNQTIFISNSKTKNGVRTIPLLPICAQIIETRPKRSVYIFTQDNGNPITESLLKNIYEAKKSNWN